jgi:hypothetical protein
MSKNIKLLIAWFLISGCIVLSAGWQAQLVVKHEIEARRHPPPPRRTRHALRPPREAWSGDVVADYKSRCEKGLTDREIGWIIEDFRSAGLDPTLPNHPTWKQILEYRKAQQRWYLGILVDALRLTPEHSAKAATQLSDLLLKAKAILEQDAETSDSSADIANPMNWIVDVNGEMMPWNLCKLSPEQESITWKKWFEDENHGESSNTDVPSEIPSQESGQTWIERSWRGPLGRELASVYVFPSSIPDDAFVVDWILPFQRPFKFAPKSPTQANNSSEQLHKLRSLHPAQFRLLLLLRPESTGAIEDALNGQLTDEPAR